MGFYAISYDIPDDRRRLRVAKTLADFGARVQYSIFECRLDAESLDRMLARLGRAIDPAEDQIRVYLLCAGCEKIVRLFGEGTVTQDPEVYIL